MMKRIVSGIVIALLLVGMLTFAFNIKPVKSEWTGTVYIRADGSIDPPDAPIHRVGDVYTFTDNIYASIVVERSNIIIDGAGYTLKGTGSGIGFNLSYINNVTIKDANIKNFFYCVCLNQSSNNKFNHNNITHNYAWIGAHKSYNNVIVDNIIAECTYGLLVGYFDANILSNNVIRGNHFGVWLCDSELNTFRHNAFVDNDYSLEVWASIDLLDFCQDIDVSNVVNGKPIYYLVNQHDMIIEPSTFPNIGYLALVNSTNILVKDLNLQQIKSGQGILLGYCENVLITNATISDCNSGVYIGGSHKVQISENFLFNNENGITVIPSSRYLIKNNTIVNNLEGINIYQSCGSSIIQRNIIKNNGVGIRLSSGNHTIVENTIEKSTWIGGIVLLKSSLWYDYTQPNYIYHNNIIDNTPQVYFEWGESSTGYIWDDGYPSGGNYWSDHSDIDLYSGPYQNETGSDGIWDHPYVIDANNKDRYPFVNPWTPTPTYVHGIDVSHHQGNINWSEVYGAGYRFAFVKASEGVGWEDSNFVTNMENGRNAGLLMGAYHFARPDLGNDAIDEALYFVSVARDYLKGGYLRPALDLEVGSSLGKEALSNWVHEWMETLKNETGIEPIIYVNSNYANNYLDTSVAKYDLWIAHWTYDPTISPNTGIWDSWDFLQYSNNGSVSGISGDVDLDLFNGDMSRLYDTFVIPENQPPVALFNYYPVEPKAGDQVAFNASFSYDPDGEIMFYAWDWNGDGDYEDYSESPMQSFWWIENGEYQVHLKVVDNTGNVAVNSTYITVAKSPSGKANVVLAAWYDWITHPSLYWKHHDAFTKIDKWLRDDDLDGQPELQPLAWLKDTGLYGKIDEADVMKIFEKQIDPEVAPNLTYEAFALSKIDEEELVHLAFKEQTPKYWIMGAPLFSYALNTAWSLGVSITTDGVAALEPLVGAGLNVVLLGTDTYDTRETFDRIDKEKFILALGSYFRERIYNPNEPAEFAWEASNARTLIEAAISPKTEQEREKILEANKGYFERLWQEYKGHARSPDLYGLSDEFRHENKESLRQLLVHALKERYPNELLSREVVHAASPIELRVHDSEGKITGVINGEVKEEIPNSVYDDETKTVKIFWPSDSYRYEVQGTGEGSYGLEITSLENGQIVNFTAIDIPTSITAVHQYTINWTALSQGEKGVIVQVDSEGDGVFEYNFTSDSELTQSEFLAQTTPPPLSVSVSPLSASILVGQSVTFTSTVSGGYTPYTYQWYLNSAPVSGATANTWTFTPTTGGIYYVYLKVTDAKANAAQSETARIAVATVPVGGYSIPIQLPTTAKPVAPHIVLLTILTALFITIKRKTKRKHTQ